MSKREPYAALADIPLMMRVRVGDESAFEELHHRYQRKLLNLFYGLSRDATLANDLCQDTFLRVWQVRRRYRATGSFPGYLFAIARMIWLEHGRRQQKIARLGRSQALDTRDLPDTASQQPDVHASRAEVEAHIFEALALLPEEQRLVFLMRSQRGMGLEEIAAALDCPLNTVRSRKLLAIKKLRHLLGGLFITHSSVSPGGKSSWTVD